MDARFEQMQAWLNGTSQTSGILHTSRYLKDSSFTTPVPASSDASFRRYFRIHSNSDCSAVSKSFVVMDAPPEHEDCRPFIEVSNSLNQMGLWVPEVLEQDLDQGFLLLGDLGTVTYFSKLLELREQGGSESEAQIDEMYIQALKALVNLQKNAKASQAAEKLPPYDARLLDTEMNLFTDWLCQEYLELPQMSSLLWGETKSLLSHSALTQPKTYVHRDYHSRNIMFNSGKSPGILDFQDAVHGALTYDAVSLLRDCYLAWPKEQVSEWQQRYFYDLCEVGICQKNEWAEFAKSMDLMGVQRHLKASGIFARLFLRDGKDGYLPDVPQTLQYIVDVGQNYSELYALTSWVEDKVQPAFASLKRS